METPTADQKSEKQYVLVTGIYTDVCSEIFRPWTLPPKGRAQHALPLYPNLKPDTPNRIPRPKSLKIAEVLGSMIILSYIGFRIRINMWNLAHKKVTSSPIKKT